ncbi:DNA repair ATPase [Streptomyces sp. DSM 44917]|uniref:DNA repair ATPase n=1 Tax=Streptomyces boetiae TaxID=3075541 RepID=A0ABU2L4K9_9ACTN|nr:DNA repair ATPase [Streptomyces sp. DSM 44917]MDT0306356.1 DNA repair ATPase [Streptomyces sp. DSM 44917]
MTAAARDLAARAEELNARRVEAFGGGGLELAATATLETGEPALPRDLAHAGGLLLLAAHVPTGRDTLTLHRLGPEGEAAPAPEDAVPGLLDAPDFRRDLEELHRYFRGARLTRLRRSASRLLAVWSTGERESDIRVLRWRLHPDGRPAYEDAKGEREHLRPAPGGLAWTEAGRESHVPGPHPHIAVDGTLFVSTLGGRLTLKTANDTGRPDGVHHEPVEEPLQSLADAQVAHARVGPLLLLRVLPYNEPAPRHFVFNTRTGDLVRLDGIGQDCRALPEDQGIVFPGGYCLADAPAGAAARTFDIPGPPGEFAYESTVHAPNGEDVLYLFRARAAGDGRCLLLPYNLIRKEVAAPLSAQGHALLEDGTLALLRAATPEPGRVHPVQLWRTPFVSEAHAAGRPAGTGPLARIGNAELVRGVSRALTVARMATELAPGTAVFEGIVAACDGLADHHPWLRQEGLAALHEPLAEVRAAAAAVVEEYRRVAELRRQAEESLTAAEEEVTALLRRARGEAPRRAAGWVALLAELREAQGRAETLREVKYADPARVDALAGRLAESLAATGRRAVAALSRPDAFEETLAAVRQLAERAAAVDSVAHAAPLAGEIDAEAARLGTVTEVIGGLDIADATVRTGLLKRIGEVLGAVNRARAVLEGRRRELAEAEGRAEFAAEFALLGQSVVAALAAARTPEECDEHLGRLLLHVENLAARFAEHEDFAATLAERREEIHETFAARRQAALDERARHAQRLTGSAGRLLETVARRAAALETDAAVHAYFAGDPLVARIRATAGELREAGATVPADELEGRLTAARQEAVRALRDRADLRAADGTIRLGRHRFSVTTQPLDLTLVPHGADGLAFAVVGTDYRAPVREAGLAAAREFFDQPLVSESPAVYRAEHLAAGVLPAALAATASAEGPETGETVAALVRAAAESAFDEGYDRGVHDHDATVILTALLALHRSADLLRHPAPARAAAQLYWAHGCAPAERAALATRAQSLARAAATFGTAATTGAVQALTGELTAAVAAFGQRLAFPGPEADPAAAGAYLYDELARGGPDFAVGGGARALREEFRAALGGPGAKELTRELHALGEDLPGLAARAELLRAWLGAFARSCGLDEADLPEAVAVELCEGLVGHRPVDAGLTASAEGLLGSHPRVRGGRLTLRLDEFLTRTGEFRTTRVPAHRAFTRRRAALLEAERERLRLETHRPRVMPAFVRNRLIDEVYLPLIGDSLAKQLGGAGEERRTDSQGLLLLLSPPGYGKTTLMEYVAARLGLAFVRVDGPALGQGTTSLDPAAAPDAAARREVGKIGLALELGTNVLLHVDDIQHVSPELLQRFIPLTDAQRRVDGVRASDGAPATFDLRGKRFAVSMAGNPFTESGTRFRLPDMLANRADVWNLGDVLAGREELFALSHIENALTANPVLAPLAGRDRADTELLVRLARGDATASADRLSHPYAPAELERVLAVLRRLLHIQRTTLAVNAAYIASAGQDDATRTEPPFRLQGSYRNTNRLAERVVPVMNEAETEALIDDHYRAEARTLTTDAEANLLKLAELRGRLTPGQAARWERLKEDWRAHRASS